MRSDSKEEFFFVRAADQLDVDGKSFGRAAQGEGDSRETGEVEPLGVTHGVAITVRLAGDIIALAVTERGFAGDRGEKNRESAKLAENGSTNKVAVGARLLK